MIGRYGLGKMLKVSCFGGMRVGEESKNEPQKFVAFSGGKDSTAVVLKLRELQEDFECVYTPTGDELPGVDVHIGTIEKFVKVHRVGLEGGFHKLIRDMNALPNWRMRFCTRMLKIAPFQAFIGRHRPCVIYVGLRADEQGRAGVEYTWDDVEVRFPLREWGWGVNEVLAYNKSQGVEIPKRTDCARCFFQTLHEWWRLWKHYPEIYADAMRDEAMIGHTYRSPGKDTHAHALKDLKKEFEDGWIPKERKRKGTCRYCTI